MKLVLRVVFGFLSCPLVCAAQSGAPAAVTFSFSNPGLQPPEYSLLIHADGAAHYRSVGSATGSAAGPEGSEFERELRVDDALRGRLFSLARKRHWFATACESKHKVAFTGTKTLSYAGPEGQGSCTFNYADDAGLNGVAGDLISVATTLEEGRKLELLLAHDRLGLDAEVESLAGEQAGGRALDLENIAPVLQAIAADEAVLTHTRTRAAALLSH